MIGPDWVQILLYKLNYFQNLIQLISLCLLYLNDLFINLKSLVPLSVQRSTRRFGWVFYWTEDSRFWTLDPPSEPWNKLLLVRVRLACRPAVWSAGPHYFSSSGLDVQQTSRVARDTTMARYFIKPTLNRLIQGLLTFSDIVDNSILNNRF